MPSVDLYYVPASSPSRAVQMLGEAIGLTLNLKLVDLRGREQYTPEFLAKNPAHAVPLIDDNGFYVAESRAIMPYLVDKFAPGSSLYPNEPNKRALINQRLFFDLGTLYKSFGDFYFRQLFFGASPDPQLHAKIGDALNVFEEILKRSTYAAGETYTIADISLLATISSFCHPHGEDIFGKGSHPHIARWFERCKSETVGWHWNQVGLDDYVQFFAALAARNAAASAVAAPVEVTAAPEVVEVSAAPEKVEVTAAPEVVEVSAAPEVVEVSAVPEAVEVSAAPEVVEVSATPEVVEVSATPEVVEVSAAPETVEVSAAPEVVAAAAPPAVVTVAEEESRETEDDSAAPVVISNTPAEASAAPASLSVN